MISMAYTRNGYVMLYMPNHHRAGKDGMLYEHIYMAEMFIGRPLEKDEEVHHEDKNRGNNTEENLFVFKTHEDHARYHKTGIMIALDDGSYISPPIAKKCKLCEKEFFKGNYDQEFCSAKCSNNDSRKVERPSKEELEKLIYIKTFTQIGKDFGVSDNAVKKWCKSYGLPYRKKDMK
jgi:hypothetical protein